MKKTTYPYRTIVPVHNLEPKRTPIQFGEGMRITTVPEWLRTDALLERLGDRDREELEDCSHCFEFEYEADGLGSPDPEWTGDRPRSIQDTKTELGYLAGLALWLVKPCPTGFGFVFHAPVCEGSFAIQSYERHSRYLCHPGDREHRHSGRDLQSAATTYRALCKIRRHSPPWTAVRAVTAALQLPSVEIRHLMLWIALEGLFGPEDGREISFRLAQRIAFFLAKTRDEAKELFSVSKKTYGFRCKVAHGSWKPKKESMELIGSTEELVRRALNRILKDDATVEAFAGRGRETYLDGLVFG